MKPGSFKYLRPHSLSEALSMLADHGDGAKVLAGGQSLIPLLNLRMATPRVLVDVSQLAELKTYDRRGASVAIGAAVTQASLLSRRDDLPPVVRSAISNIGHMQIRNRGTVGGSLCHNDPAAEWPALARALDLQIFLRRRDGTRQLHIADFHTGPLMTDAKPDEIVTHVLIPEVPRRWGFAEVARRSGDFAQAGAVAGEFASGWRVVVFGVGSGPQRLSGVETHLSSAGRPEAVPEIVRAEAVVGDDLNGSPAYRRHLAAGIVDQVVRQACG
jgi:carbon-monoxide dehydrogenase medium subunit